MSNDIVTEARNKAGNNFKKGYNCAESIFLTFRELVAPELDTKLVRMVTGFGGGLGHAGCICGALNSAEMIIGLFTGRTGSREDREPGYNAAREFHDLFQEHFGGTCCRVLNPHPFDTPEHLKNCIKITGTTGKLLMEYLIEKNLLKPGNNILTTQPGFLA
ncbi:MAG: C-GCAxxG-C-C family protein [Desulfitobacteriaceae bacterium]|nr:C-GCAxxG-C-C family protein [Desulfitobacteriaceae bacterium]MDD4346402.1 C-GCAxxG-C-C family protein [Desulfitobacteriaceae bacterium]MDD4401674.1 C-GCAxxG-C-C family protein [Desulfitobacteriaceae bacterium]